MARHTFATTNALAQGIRIEVVSRMLGHTNEHDAALCEDFGGEYQSGDEKNRRNTIGIVWNIDRQRGGPSKPRPLSVFILSFQTVDRRETFVLPAQLGDDLGVAALDDPPEPRGLFGRQRIARDRLVVDPQRLVRENRLAANFVRPCTA